MQCLVMMISILICSLRLERFDVDTGALKEPAVERIFRAWVEEWEEEARKKNDYVEEARLLTSIKDLFSMIRTQELQFLSGI